MAFDAKPRTWLGAAARVDTGISIPVTAISTSTFEVTGVTLAEFIRNDDPVYAIETFNTVTANVVQYIRALTTSGGNTRFGLASAPSWVGTPTNRTWTNGISKTLYVPDRIWFTMQNTGITGVPVGLATFDAAKANRTTGDIRYFFLELPKMLRRLWTEKNAGDRPARVRTDSHDFIADPVVATRNYTFELDLSYSTTAVANEPAV